MSDLKVPSFDEIRQFMEKPEGVHGKVAKAHPALAAGKVVCVKCGKPQMVDTAECLRSGWPKCCGLTMQLREQGE